MHVTIFDTLENTGGQMRFGTEATRAMLNALGSPDDKLKIIHVAGTNGKGSVAEYLTRILIAAEKKVGTFQSPQAASYFEQFRVNGEPIEESKLSAYFEGAYAVSGGATSFEVQTAGAIYAFYKEGCEYAVIECGMGGTLDATNAVNKKEIAIISSISLEHTRFLGNTIKEICAQKAGIIKNCPAIINPKQSAEAIAYFKKIGAILADEPYSIHCDLHGTSFVYGGKQFFTPLIGEYQAYNAATAIAAARALKIDENAIHIGISKAQLAGRTQVFSVKCKTGCENSRYKTVIVDGAHNPAAMACLAKTLEFLPKENTTVIFGCLADKDIEGNLAAIENCASSIIAVKPESPRAADLDIIVSACKRHFADVSYENSVSAALDKAQGNAVVCGSFTLVKEALEWIEKRL